MRVKDIYERELKRARDRRYYYQKKYGVKLPEVKRVKKPDRGSIEALKKRYVGGEEKIQKTAKRYEKRQKKSQDTARIKPPSAWEVMRENIIKAIEEGMNDTGVASSFTKWKAEEIWTKLEDLRYTGSLNWKMVWERWETADSEIERFIFNSKNKGDVSGFLQRVEAILTGSAPVTDYTITEDEEEEMYYE